MILIKELKSPTKIGPIYLKDLAFIGIYFLTFFFLRGFIASALLIPYLIYNVLVAIVLAMPSMWNPGKRMWQAIFFIIIKDRKIYKPISINERSDDFEQEE